MHRLLGSVAPPILRSSARPELLRSAQASNLCNLGRRPRHDRGLAMQTISEDRLQEFLQAEVKFFARQETTSISISEILQKSEPENAADMCHAELPIRFAQRILQIEDIPTWKSCPELVEVHKLYSHTFRDLRLQDLNFNNMDPFTEMIQTLKERMKGVIPNLAMGMRRLKMEEGWTEAQITEWLDTFLLSRIGTEMLTSQYIACTTANIKTKKNRKGIVDQVCDPASICEQAAKQTKKVARQHFKNIDREPLIIVEHMHSDSRVKFPYVPQYLFYIMVELLKNSARATVDTALKEGGRLEDRPIVISVGADNRQIAIRVHDKAGGIPFNVADNVWSYMYSTATKGVDTEDFSSQGTPLAGYGVGLPLSRLYARYLGGSLHLMSMPGVGTSAYLYLKRLEEDAKEQLPTSVGSLSDPSSSLLG
mmetsp:Transcript_95766/g.249510  ORF Transcript_95766/g.249510 Transcript_95766/m.249510 type:complete len:423 (-) Transcript_95766:32-1300(-)